MICDFCKKNKATIHLIRVQNDNVEKVNICAECAEDFTFFSEDDFYKDLTKILYKIFKADEGQPNGIRELKNLKNLEIRKNRACSFCGMDLKNIKKLGKMGCPNCYREFKNILLPIIKAIHKNIEHRGKIPENTTRQIKLEKSIRDLRNRLKREIFVENFEEAARIRDEIRQLEKNIYE
jgi:protein arginine kinase activator